MAHYERNSIILTEDEAAKYNKKLDEVTSIVEYIVLIKEIYLLADFNIDIRWSPTFKKHTYYGEVIPCFHSNGIFGYNTDLTGKNREVYSLSVRTAYQGKFLRIHTGSGGGGSNWRYDNAFIDIRKFPGILNKYPGVIAESLVETERLKFQTNFDKELDTILIKVENSERSAAYSYEVTDLTTKLAQLKKLEHHIETLIQSAKTNYVVEDLKKANITVPTKAASPFISLTKYNQVTSKLRSIHPSEVLFKQAMSEAEFKYEEFRNHYPELFI